MPSSDRRTGIARLAVPLLLSVVTLVAAAAGALSAPSEPGAAVAVVFPPWWPREHAAAAVAAAGGLIVREGINGAVLVIRPTDPMLAERLRENGAWLIVNPLAAGGCLTPPRHATRT